MTAATRGEGTATRLGRWLGLAVRVAVAVVLLAGLLGLAGTSVAGWLAG